MVKILRIGWACLILFIGNVLYAQSGESLLNKPDLDYLRELTRVVLDSSRIYPGQRISPDFGPNNTGITLIRPGGMAAYPAFWIRDYAMSVETGLVSIEEQKQLLRLTASRQCDSSFSTTGGYVPLGAIADHIRIDDGQPIYYPGTYSVQQQGDGTYGKLPPLCDQFYFIQMAWHYVEASKDRNILLDTIQSKTLIDRLEAAFAVAPARLGNELVYTTDAQRAVDFGFRDVITITGDLCLASILKYNAALQLGDCFMQIRQPKKAAAYRKIAAQIKEAIPQVFQDKTGMLLASNGKSNQPDVWATAMAIYYNILEGKSRINAAKALSDAYQQGTISYRGNIRHVPLLQDFDRNTMWEFSLAEKGSYQNGAYWGTPVGWVCAAIAAYNPDNARKLAADYIRDLREHDFRKGGGNLSPVECFTSAGLIQNPLYLATVACPLIVFSKER